MSLEEEPSGPSMASGGFAFESEARVCSACVVGPWRCLRTRVINGVRPGGVEIEATVKGLKRNS